jgi:hypothetical protein
MHVIRFYSKIIDAENRTVGNIQSASFGGSGIVPHLGAHLAELCTIEGYMINFI